MNGIKGRIAGTYAAVALTAIFAVCAPSQAKALEPGPGKPETGPVIPDVPGDIFGFTDATSIEEAGKQGASITADGSFGKRDGSYGELSKKYAFGRVIAPRTSFEVALFTVWHSISNVSAIPINREAIQFNGASLELAYALVRRGVDNPFGVKIAIEPRWSQIDGSGRRAAAYSSEFKIGVDAPVIPDKLFWAANLVLEIQRAKVAATPVWQTASSVKLSSALSLALNQAKAIFLGVEATYVRSYNGIIGSFAGHSVYVGPTFLVKLNGRAAISGTIAPQIAGKAKGVPGNLDLESGAKYIVRLKLGVEF